VIDVRIHLNPSFGERRLNQITTEAIIALRLALTQTAGHSCWQRPLSASTIARVGRTLSSIFDSAVRTKRLAANPCKSLERAYVRQKQGKRQDGKIKPDEILNPDEIHRLIDAAHQDLSAR
jgi:hypothetical protein